MKKRISILMAVVLLLALLAGCAKNADMAFTETNYAPGGHYASKTDSAPYEYAYDEVDYKAEDTAVTASGSSVDAHSPDEKIIYTSEV